MSSDSYRWHYDYARLAVDAGFSFQTYRSKSLDKIIGHIDIDYIIRERDVATIEKCISAVVEFSLDNDQTSVLDPTFVKIFHISQLSVQYLQFCKKYLDNSVIFIKQEYQKAAEENKNFKRQIDELHQESSNYKKQIKELKSALNSQIVPSQSTAIFQCKECPKAFSSEEYLIAHIKRRHESLGIVIAPSNSTFQIETDKLQLEIKELKDRLNNTEKFVSYNEFMSIRDVTRPSTEQNNFVTELQVKFEHLKSHVDNELMILQTQKFEKEKYEKWFETFLSNKLNVASSAYTKPTMASTGTQGEMITNNCTTQTESLSSHTTCENCEARQLQKINEFPIAVPVQDHIEKLKTRNHEEVDEKLQLETENRLEKFEEMLEEKVTGSIEKLENKIQTFLEKMNELEEYRVKNKPILPAESIEVLVTKAAKPKKNVDVNKTTFNYPSLTTGRSMENIKNQVTIENPTPTNQITKTVTINKFCSSSSESDDESDSNESETDDDCNEEIITINKPTVKVSATSTLGRRSLTSLKEAAFTPEVLAQLQKEIEKVMHNRLQEVGVNPKLKGIPVRSYQRALGIVTHQASVIQKNVSNYMQIRRQILKDVDNQVADRSKIVTPAKSSKLKSLLTNFRNRSRTVTNPRSIIPKILTTQTRNAPTDNAKALVNLSESETDSSFVIRNKSNLVHGVSNSARVVVDIPPESTDSESVAKVNVNNAHTTDANGIDDRIPEHELQTKGVLKNYTILGSHTTGPLENSRDANIKDHPINESELQTKGVLKNYTVASSVSKKKVIFDLNSGDSKENVKAIVQTKTAEGGSTTSIASSVFDGSKTSFVENQPQPEQKKKQELYDSSDWELSEVSSN